jgi:hypothetical protein
MSEKAQITFAAPAIKNLEDLQAHYSDESSPDAGKRLTAEIVGKVERLARIR